MTNKKISMHPSENKKTNRVNAILRRIFFCSIFSGLFTCLFAQTAEQFYNKALKELKGEADDEAQVVFINYKLAVDYLSRAIALDPQGKHYRQRADCKMNTSFWNPKEAVADYTMAIQLLKPGNDAPSLYESK
jgi:hypothetical protein